jgi:hypothetical protein
MQTKNINKLQPFESFASNVQKYVLILQRCLLILMFNGLRTKAGGSVKR